MSRSVVRRVLLFRGVPQGHPAFSLARAGRVRIQRKQTPATLDRKAGASRSDQPDVLRDLDTASKHNATSTALNQHPSGHDLTSWTRDRSVAARYAGPGGVVLEGELGPPDNALVWSPDAWNEAEVLVRGDVEDLRVSVVQAEPAAKPGPSGDDEKKTG